MVKRKHSHYKKKMKHNKKIELNQDKPSAEQTSNITEMHLSFVDMA